jgi:cell division protein FtsW (lipid II flippase)
VSSTKGLYAQFFDRRRLTLPLLFPCVGGIYYLWSFDAPARLLAVNAGAVVLALVWIMFGRLPTSRTTRLAMAGAAALALFLPLLIGQEVGGVQRWLPAGPVSLHSAALLLPLITVLAAREERLGPAILALAGAALAMQPDAAALIALAAASAVLAWLHRSVAFATVTAAGAALGVLTFAAGTLEPQIYTENVLAHVAERSVFKAILLAILLFVVPLWHWVIDPQVQRSEGYALAALLTAFGVMAMIAPFPFPLIGYGASPILGFGLALGAAARRDQLRAGEFLDLMDRTK